MKYTNNALRVLAIRTFKGIGPAKIAEQYKMELSDKEIINVMQEFAKEEITLENFEKRKKFLESQLLKFSHCMDGVIAIGDENFPKYRGKVKSSERPIFLFYKGDISLLSQENKNIAVIGLLNPDKEIEIFERKVVKYLTQKNITIVSGLALGCDSIAHAETLENNGKTIAILPSTLDKILPKENIGLAEKIIKQGGLLITEYLNESSTSMEQRGRYVQRDRLQALFSDGVLLSASYREQDIGDSGSRYALGYAKNYELPRAVLFDEKMFEGNPKYNLNRQMRDEGAIIITNEFFMENLDNFLQTHKNDIKLEQIGLF